MEREYLPTPRPLSLPQLPSLFFPAHFSFRAYVRAEAPRGGTPIHYIYGYVPPKGVVILKLLI